MMLTKKFNSLRPCRDIRIRLKEKAFRFMDNKNPTLYIETFKFNFNHETSHEDVVHIRRDFFVNLLDAILTIVDLPVEKPFSFL